MILYLHHSSTRASLVCSTLVSKVSYLSFLRFFISVSLAQGNLSRCHIISGFYFHIQTCNIAFSASPLWVVWHKVSTEKVYNLVAASCSSVAVCHWSTYVNLRPFNCSPPVLFLFLSLPLTLTCRVNTLVCTILLLLYWFWLTEICICHKLCPTRDETHDLQTAHPMTLMLPFFCTSSTLHTKHIRPIFELWGRPFCSSLLVFFSFGGAMKGIPFTQLCCHISFLLFTWLITCFFLSSRGCKCRLFCLHIEHATRCLFEWRTPVGSSEASVCGFCLTISQQNLHLRGRESVEPKISILS